MTMALLDALLLTQDRLTLQQLVLLLVVGEQPGLSVNEIADLSSLSQPVASRTLGFLLGRYDTGDGIPTAYMEQRISPDDPRRRALYLTQEGRELVEQVNRALKLRRVN